MKRKICVVTGTRADYGLLTPLIKEIENDDALQLQLVVTGMHLCDEFGLTYKEIEKEFKIDRKIDILLSSDTSVGISKSMGLAQIGFGEVYEELKPDIVVVLGDRFEILSAVSSAMIARIPIAHLSGGELTMGAVDDAIRHSITKMSHLHFVATDEYKKRVMQLGEDESRIYNFGEAGLDNIRKLKLLGREEFEDSIDFRLAEKNLLFTYHPATLDDKETIISDFQNILDALEGLKETNIIFTKANSDAGGRVINAMLEEFTKKHKNSVLFASLGQLRYLSALQYVDAVVGNSSSGIVEAPSFKIGTVNIGDRQKGRVQSKSVINCGTEKDSIAEALRELYSDDFQKNLKNIINPYEQKDSAFRTKEVLKSVSLKDIIKKEFRDII